MALPTIPLRLLCADKIFTNFKLKYPEVVDWSKCVGAGICNQR